MGNQNIAAALYSFVTKMEDDYKLERDVTGLSTGFTDLDRMTAGLQPGDLVVVAGRPSIGKTSFVTNIAENVALESKLPVSIFNMEMDTRRLVTRMVASTGRVNSHSMVSARIENDDWSRMTNALGVLNEAPIEFMDTLAMGWDSEAIEQTLQDRDDAPALLIVDGLHSFDLTNFSNAYDRNAQLAEHARLLKRLALSLNIPIILTATLGRELESRPNKRPVMKDLRDIGTLEDLADLVLFVYRDEMYNPDTPERGKAEIIIGKQRNGPVGTIELIFRPEYLHFENNYRRGY